MYVKKTMNNLMGREDAAIAVVVMAAQMLSYLKYA